MIWKPNHKREIRYPPIAAKWRFLKDIQHMIDCIKIKDALRYKEQGLSQSQISARIAVPKSTLRGWLKQCAARDITYSIVREFSSEQVKKMLNRGQRLQKSYYEPEFDVLVASAIEKKGSAQESYEDYCKECPVGKKPMSRSSFFRRFKAIKEAANPDLQRLYLHNNFRPGSVIMIDYCGDTIPICDTQGRHRKAQIFVAVLGYSGLIFCCATESQKRDDWIRGCTATFTFYTGVTDEIWLDNSTSCVRKAHRVDPVLASEFENFCRYYNTEGIAVAPGEATYKGLVENAVKQIQNFVLKPLTQRKFFSLEELNRSLLVELTTINDRPLTNHPGMTRQARFTQSEQQTLKPLPRIAYDKDFQQLERKVLKGNQIRIGNIRYNLPLGFVGKKVQILVNQRTSEMNYFLLETGELIGNAHLRNNNDGDEPMRVEFLPDHLKPYVMSREALLMKIEKELGHQALLFAHTLARQANSKAQKHLMALLRAAKRYSGEELEAICAETLCAADVTYATFRKICTLYEDKSRSKKTKKTRRLATNTAVHTPSDIRGAQYFNDGENHD